METRTRKTSYALPALNLQALNQMLTRIGARLDQLEGIAQNPDLHGRTIKNVGAGSAATDAARVGQVEDAVNQITVIGGGSGAVRAGVGISITEMTGYVAVAVKQQGALTDLGETAVLADVIAAVNDIHEKLRAAEVVQP